MADVAPRSDEARRLFDVDALRYFARYYDGARLHLALFTLGASAQSFLVIPVLALVRRAFDEAIPASDTRALLLIGAAIFAVRTVGSIITLLLRALILRIVKGAVAELRRDLVDRLFMLSREHYARENIATLHTRIVQDSERVDRLSDTVLSGLLPAVFASIVLAGVLVVLDWQLVLLTVVVVPPLWLCGRLSGRLVKREVRVFQRAFESFSNGVQFVLRQMDLIRLKANETPESRRQHGLGDSLRFTSQRMAMSYAIHAQTQRTLTGLAGITILVAGGIAVAQGRLTLGELLSFYVAAGLLNGYVDTLVSGVPELIAGSESLGTLRRIMTTGEEAPYRGSRQVTLDGRIDFEGVTFGYGDAPLVRDVNLSLSPGANVAIIGANGAGKSTLIQLLTGMYRPQAGRLRAAGVSYDDLDMSSLRRQIGVVPQHPLFFGGTIRENVLYGAADVPASDIDDAVSRSLTDVLLSRLEHGMETTMGERGVLLSGGECQRLAIARALLGRPRVLVLDEPTTHLDIDTVRQLMQRLVDWPGRPTLLIISHDPAVIEFADEVHQLQDGRLSPADPAQYALSGAVAA